MFCCASAKPAGPTEKDFGAAVLDKDVGKFFIAYKKKKTLKARVVALHSPYVMDWSVLLIAHKFTLVERLDLQGCLQLTDESMKHVAENCHSLESLDISGCESVTDAGVNCFAFKCSGLTNMNLSRTGITDKGLDDISEHFAKLSSLKIAGTKCTDMGIEHLVEGCSLTSLDVTRCDVGDPYAS